MAGRPLEPGQTFEIEYGDGKRTSVIAQSLRKKSQIASHLKAITTTNDLDNFSRIVELVLICKPDADEAFLDSIDESMAMQIVQATITLTEAEQKKSESQPS